MSKQLKYEQRKLRRDELLKLFAEDSGYAELSIANKVYVKRYDNTYNLWTVAVYTRSSFARYKAFQDNQLLDLELAERIAREP